ncbi:unnamed protein product [Prunus armeniaca]|uniref:Uncharacterized protein n=1 Tax=Prunus armeniaca TaxID=36596 RepID=A0A6J5UB76_PRUAR|nr:unnamed protein product [Prunus armeniaca]
MQQQQFVNFLKAGCPCSSSHKCWIDAELLFLIDVKVGNKKKDHASGKQGCVWTFSVKLR